MGKIKRIQFRGISRTPSDRLTADGGCAESLNVYLDSEETAPVLKPEDITEQLGIPGDKQFEKVFIHKVSHKENYILIGKTDDLQVCVGVYEDSEFKKLAVLEQGESVSDITSIGNTVIIATSKRMLYLLLKGNKYSYLGDRIPEPHMEFRCAPEPRYSEASIVRLLNDSDGLLTNDIDLFNLNAWDKAIDAIERNVEDSTGSKERLLELQDEVWTIINKRINDNRSSRIFTKPVFVRYAVRLYDGSYIYQSVPILLGAGYDKFVEVTGSKTTSSAGISTYLSIKPSQAFKATAHLVKWDKEGWDELIESVDLFVSLDVDYPAMKSNFSKIELSYDGNQAVDIENYTLSFDNGGVSDMVALEKELLSKNLFYKIASFKPSDVNDLEQGFNILDSDHPVSQDDLATDRERLPDYEQSGTDIIPSNLLSYNNRIIANGAKRRLPSGYSFIQSTNIVKMGQHAIERSFAYIIPGADGQTHKVIGRTPDGYDIMTPYGIDTSDEGGASFTYSNGYGLMFYPDPRCERVLVWDPSGDVMEIEMKPHPFLNCSYAFWGLSKTIEDYPNQAMADVTIGEFVEDENRYEDDSQKIYQSEANNPFYFPIAGNKTLSSKVLGLAVATLPLSEGQFGQFPFYAFTEDGIWAMETAEDGRFISSKPLSREVCSNPASITTIDQAVAFMSSKGLMLLQGSQITELSPFMNGRHYTINDSAKTIIEAQPKFCDLMPSLMDPTPFMAFMKDATIGYDYPGKRLICFNKNEAYQYVYKLDTQTWHKLYHPGAAVGAMPLNSYPRCEVMTVADNVTRIVDFSTSLDGSNTQIPEQGVIVSRPFDLEEPDVLKTITDVRVRGQFAKGAVKFILQGSQDGINFYTISTLRGKAWKMFRIILLADLALHERISWVDVMYESRFNNRLR